VAKVTLSDVKIVHEDDVMSNFMISKQNIGKNRATASEEYARRLNPMVQVNVLEKTLLEVTSNAAELDAYDMVIQCEMIRVEDVIKINHICREKNIKFMIGNVWNTQGFFFSDLGTHEYVFEFPVRKNKVAKIEKRKSEFRSFERIFDNQYSQSRADPLNRRTESYFFNLLVLLEYYRSTTEHPSSLEDIRKYVDTVKEKINAPTEKFDKITQFEGNLSKAAPSVSAIVGGVMAQEVVKVASQKDDPFENTFYFNGIACEGVIAAL